ncbi:hypothetical protein [Leekyejoonella antrihumi]|uniref:Uncharacterized protein n=1 Tax=Leekyejoonella antrihumi TaxID=1660198 RepID=A0A563E253_9MICO|nr:hypothetical protein [Leekyejoonella antrihumi]TWP36369.1 hypothetical protein FGL98_10440 [Leekyejoonella antrihumi]
MVRKRSKRLTDRLGLWRRAHYPPTRTCSATGKYCFPDRRAARRALQDAAAARRIAAEALGDPNVSRRHECRAYRCTHCRAWHLTSHPPEKTHAAAVERGRPTRS